MCRFTKLSFARDTELVIGSGESCAFRYDDERVLERHASLSYVRGSFAVRGAARNAELFVNAEPLASLERRALAVGDVVRIADLVFAIGLGVVSVNAPRGFVAWPIPGVELLSHETVREHGQGCLPQLGELPTFFPSPRLTRVCPSLTLVVDAPPAKEENDEQPLLLQVGPSLLMGMTSTFMAVSSLTRLAGGADLLATVPSISMATTMIAGSLIWPFASRRFRAKRSKHAESRRSQLYVAYLDEVERRFLAASTDQAVALHERRAALDKIIGCTEELTTVSAAKRDLSTMSDTSLRLLMNRTSFHDDFMELRVGVGDMQLQADVTWPERHFSIVQDHMLERVDELSSHMPLLHDVPLAFNPNTHRVSGVVGARDAVWAFVRGLVGQVCTLHSYHEVKVALISDEADRVEWDFLTPLAHFYDSDGTRFVALSDAGLMALDRLLGRELDHYLEAHSAAPLDTDKCYLVICANESLVRRSNTVRRVLARHDDVNISLLYVGSGLSDLPRECDFIIDLAPERTGGLRLPAATSTSTASSPRCARMLERSDVAGTLAWFDPDIQLSRSQARVLALGLSHARLETTDSHSTLPDSCGLLTSLHVGNVTQLEVERRWEMHDPSQSLAAPIGIGLRGETLVLDLHERMHGPHGLIAGTTGSGKSELIITYITSLAANYAPDEVSFLLIDYKGGSLADAFASERHRLPHLVGTISNLDGASIHRSLVALTGELRRRQDLFRQARQITGEATMDIYRYLSFWRQGVLSEACPHLVVIADEFAELKGQQPAFMNELVSAARIGRSLGVHLVLATQRPSGVVDEQIWSNSRFKICLKVADAADSREMIRSDVAAEITQVGRFYLLVGYNEALATGQAAWAGGPYIARDHPEEERDLSVELLDGEGRTIARLRPATTPVQHSETELDVVLDAVAAVGKRTGRYARPLWMPPLAPRITLAELSERYGVPTKQDFVVSIGELDDPEYQLQERLEVNLADVGNIMLYGPTGSGVEELACTMAVSLVQVHSPQQLWLYAIDFGAGVFSALKALPQCGGVVTADDDERLGHLIRLLHDEIERRRRLSVEHGVNCVCGERVALKTDTGTFYTLLPRIVIVLANLATLEELHPELSDELIMLTREGPRYGLHFVMSTSSPTEPRLRLKINFGLELPVMLADTADYASVLGPLDGANCAHQERRGLVRKGDRILEFQGAAIADTSSQEQKVISDLRHLWEPVPSETPDEAASGLPRRIPQLPAPITASDLTTPPSLLSLPVGFNRLTVEPVWLDMSDAAYTLVVGNDPVSLTGYLRAVVEVLTQTCNANWYAIDSQEILGSCDDARILTTPSAIARLVSHLETETSDASILLITSIAQTMTSLPKEISERLADWLSHERGAGSIAVVAATELWRTRSLYQDWWKVVSALGNGVWIGSGFAEQSTLPFGRLRPEYRQDMACDDGFVVCRGEVIPVRLLASPSDLTKDAT